MRNMIFVAYLILTVAVFAISMAIVVVGDLTAEDIKYMAITVAITVAGMHFTEQQETQK